VLEEVEVVGVGVAGGEVAPGERGAEDRHELGTLGGAEGSSGLDASRVLDGLASWELGAAGFIGWVS
jgi:hypothetical protein